MPLKEKILVSLFQSVSPRTAGFETIAYNSMSNVTIGVVIFLMFVGASPNSTGGGVKTTTLFVFIFSVITAIFNRPYIVVNGRKIKDDTVAIIDAPLLFESGLNKMCDKIIGVIAKRETQIERIIARDDIDYEQAEKRLSVQQSNEFYMKNCDDIILNNSLLDIEQNVEKVMNKYNLKCKNYLQKNIL